MKKLTIIFIVLILIMSIFIDVVDISNIKLDTTLIKYSGIILCFIYSTMNINKTKKSLISLALFFTLIADLFLLVLDKYYEIGVGVFIIVQIIYLIYLADLSKIYKDIILRAIIYLIILIVLLIIKENALVTYLSAFYFINLICNIIKSFSKKNDYLILSIGLLLFSCCDICVGLYNILYEMYDSSGIINLVYHITCYGMWFFYLPSQGLIALHTYRRRLDEK